MIRVVLADDADDLRTLVRLELELDARFQVVGEARDGEEALARVAEQAHDLLLLDLAMPHMDGLEVLQQLRQQQWTRPVVVFSGFSSQAMVDRALALGATAYIDKGRDLHEIPGILAAAVAGAAEAAPPPG